MVALPFQLGAVCPDVIELTTFITSHMALVADPLKRASDGSFESSSGVTFASLSAIQEEDLESFSEPEMALLIKKFTRAYNNIKNKKRGGRTEHSEAVQAHQNPKGKLLSESN